MKKVRTSGRNSVAQAAKKANARGSKGRSAAIPSDPDERAQRMLARLSGDDAFAARLVQSGFASIPQIAMLSSPVPLGRSAGKLTRADEQALNRTQQYARRMATYASDRAMTAALARGPNGMWVVGGFSGKVPGHLPCHCGCCDSIFSLKAYLFDLLDLLAHYWGVVVPDVEALLLRSFDQMHLFDPAQLIVVTQDVNCETLNAALPQARIAAEVLEAYLGKLGVALSTDAAAWKRKFADGLLRLITPRAIQIVALAGEPSTQALTIAKVQAQANLPADVAAAVADWKSKLDTLVLNLAGIDEAVALLSDYGKDFTGFAPGTLRSADEQDTTPDDIRMREVTTRFETARVATMRQWLADYRDTLVAASGKAADTLEVSLFISLSSSPCRTTTRLQELVTSVQQIVENIRSGEIAALNRPDLAAGTTDKLQAAVDLPLAETAWQRFRDYETWLGYLYGWVYPENVVNPLVLGFLDPSVQNSPLAVRLAYLDKAAAPPFFSGYDKESLAEGAKTETLEQWTGEVDAARAAAEFRSESAETPYAGLDLIDADLLFPLAAAKVLSPLGFFAEAHDWLRLLYDPTTRWKAAIFEEVVAGAGQSPGSASSAANRDWTILSILSPSQIAGPASGCATRSWP